MPEVVTPLNGTAWSDEERRIRTAYDKRPKGAARYSWTSASHLFQQQERERQVLKTLQSAGLMPLAGLDILEVGCGSGAWLGALVRWDADPSRVKGADLLASPLARARRRVPASVGLSRASAANLPYADASFDVVLQATVLSSMLDPGLRRRTAEEMRRVLRPGGVILWFDFFYDNPGNRDVSGIGRKEVAALFPRCDIALRRFGLAPPLSRRVAKVSYVLAYLLARVPLLSTHYLGTIRPRA